MFLQNLKSGTSYAKWKFSPLTIVASLTSSPIFPKDFWIYYALLFESTVFSFLCFSCYLIFQIDSILRTFMHVQSSNIPVESRTQTVELLSWDKIVRATWRYLYVHLSSNPGKKLKQNIKHALSSVVSQKYFT